MNCKNMKSLWFAILNYCICLSLCYADTCKNQRFSVEAENIPNYCIECRICSENQTGLHYQRCKKKIPEHIPGQGYAWCTAEKFPMPHCSSWEVSNGHVNCSQQNVVMSKCNVVCNSGYKIVNDQVVACTDFLQWNVSESLRPSCTRKDPPGVPKISSSVLDSKVKAGTTVTLRCKNTTELVGRSEFIWKFNNIDLYNLRTQPSYQLVSVKKTDEGSYRCVIKDELGESHPTEYKLDVEEGSIATDVENKKLLFALLTVLLAVVMTGILCIVIFCRNYLKEKIKICFGNFSGMTTDYNSTSSNDTINEAKAASNHDTTYIGMPDGEGKDYSTTNTGLCCLQDPQSPSLDSCASPLIKQGNLNTMDEAKATSLGTGSFQDTTYNSMPVCDGNNYSTNTRFSLFRNITKTYCVQNQKMSSLDSSDSPLLKPSDLTETANSNQQALKNMMNNSEIMKEIKKIMDQIPDSNNENPTYRDLAKFLEMDENDICNFEFICKRDGQSPTENLLHNMRAKGDGIDKFNLFLSKFSSF